MTASTVRVRCAQSACEWTEVTAAGNELSLLRRHYAIEHSDLDAPVEANATPVELAATPTRPTVDDQMEADRWVTLDVLRDRPGVLLLWGDESVSVVQDGSDLIENFAYGQRSELLRTLMVARLRWIADRLEGGRG